MEVLEFKKEEMMAIMKRKNPEFEVIERQWLRQEKGWKEHYSLVVKRVSDGKYLVSYYTTGCDWQVGLSQSAYEYDDPILYEAELKYTDESYWGPADDAE